ncbi:MAG: hypothetical protein ACK4E8_05625 [Lacibacter sp.]
MMVYVQLTAAQPEARLLVNSGTISCALMRSAGTPGRVTMALRPVDAGTDVAQTFVCSTGADYTVSAFAALPVHPATRLYLSRLQQKHFQELRLGVYAGALQPDATIGLLISIDDGLQ